MINPYRHPISTPVPELIGKFSIADSPSPKPQAEAAPEVVEAASFKAEKQFADHHSDLAAIIYRALCMYRFDTDADRARAHEVARIVSKNAALARQHGAREDAEGLFKAGWQAQIAFSRRSPPCLGDVERAWEGYKSSRPAAPATDVGEAV